MFLRPGMHDVSPFLGATGVDFKNGETLVFAYPNTQKRNAPGFVNEILEFDLLPTEWQTKFVYGCGFRHQSSLFQKLDKYIPCNTNVHERRVWKIKVDTGYFNPDKSKDLRVQQYFNTLMGSCACSAVAVSQVTSVVAMGSRKGKADHVILFIVNLPIWVSSFTQENDGSEAAEPIRCSNTVGQLPERAFRNFLRREDHGKAND